MIWIVSVFQLSGCMLAFGGLLAWAWPGLTPGSPSRAAAALIVGALYFVTGIASWDIYSGYEPFWLLFVDAGDHRHGLDAGAARMRRFIITGAPGAGKTAIIRQLELDGFSVVEEAATDVIAAAQAQGTAQPWTHPSFIDVVAKLQRDRQIRASYQPDEVQFHDRCAVCTAALAVYLGHAFSPFLASELERVKKEAIYQQPGLLHSQSWLHHAYRSAANQL